jgi:predicted CXXCH cytochrome family protein
MAKIKDHAGTENQACASCHDPHFGTDKYFLKAKARESTPAK